MLDRETCEALAKAYPEVREHRFHAGDWCFFRVGDAAVYADDPHVLEVGNAIQGYDLWRLRLDQLLDLAHAVRPSDGESRLALMAGRLSTESPEGGWIFGVWWLLSDDWAFWPAEGGEPEAAVAAWLLANAPEGSPGMTG